MIKFDKMEPAAFENFKGGEGIFHAAMFADELNRIFKGTLSPGATIGMHTHDTSSEIIFILSGNGKTVCDGVEERVTAGDCLYCKKGSTHTLINDSDKELVFYAVVPQQ